MIDLYNSDTDLPWEQASAQYDMEEQDLETRSGEDCLFCRAVNFETIQDIISQYRGGEDCTSRKGEGTNLGTGEKGEEEGNQVPLHTRIALLPLLSFFFYVLLRNVLRCSTFPN